jgi:uncharacterized protein (TIGR02246 family)
MLKRLVTVTLMLLFVAGAAFADSEEQIRKASKTWEVAFNAADGEGLAALYRPDAMLLPPNQGFVEGRDAIGEFWAPFTAEIDGKLDIREIVVRGDLGYVIGTYELVDAEGSFVDRGKYIEVWRQVDGEWALHRDIWNSSMPAAGKQPE